MTATLNFRTNNIYDEVEMQSPVQNDTILENPAANNEGTIQAGIFNSMLPVQVFNNKGKILLPWSQCREHHYCNNIILHICTIIIYKLLSHLFMHRMTDFKLYIAN